MTEAFPLQWPEGWPRTRPEDRTYNQRLKRATFDAARQQLMEELRRLDATNIVLSTNIPLRRDGMPYASLRPNGDDPGIAVYFMLRGRQMAMARDCYDSIAQNLRSLGMAIEHLRGLDRHGGAPMLERAFAGFAALPPPASGSSESERPINWREEFAPIPAGLAKAELLEIINLRYRTKAKQAYADAGGSDAAMIRLNTAITQARKELA